MENIIAEEDDLDEEEEGEDDENNEAALQVREDFSPSQPVLLSQKQGLLADALQKEKQTTKD